MWVKSVCSCGWEATLDRKMRFKRLGINRISVVQSEMIAPCTVGSANVNLPAVAVAALAAVLFRPVLWLAWLPPRRNRSVNFAHLAASSINFFFFFCPTLFRSRQFFFFYFHHLCFFLACFFSFFFFFRKITVWLSGWANHISIHAWISSNWEGPLVSPLNMQHNAVTQSDVATRRCEGRQPRSTASRTSLLGSVVVPQDFTTRGPLFCHKRAHGFTKPTNLTSSTPLLTMDLSMHR